MELFHTERKKTTRVLSVIYLIATAVIALGYSVFYVEVALPNGSTGQLLDIMDYISVISNLDRLDHETVMDCGGNGTEWQKIQA